MTMLLSTRGKPIQRYSHGYADTDDENTIIFSIHTHWHKHKTACQALLSVRMPKPDFDTEHQYGACLIGDTKSLSGRLLFNSRQEVAEFNGAIDRCIIEAEMAISQLKLQKINDGDLINA